MTLREATGSEPRMSGLQTGPRPLVNLSSHLWKLATIASEVVGMWRRCCARYTGVSNIRRSRSSRRRAGDDGSHRRGGSNAAATRTSAGAKVCTCLPVRREKLLAPIAVVDPLHVEEVVVVLEHLVRAQMSEPRRLPSEDEAEDPFHRDREFAHFKDHAYQQPASARLSRHRVHHIPVGEG